MGHRARGRRPDGACALPPSRHAPPCSCSAAALYPSLRHIRPRAGASRRQTLGGLRDDSVVDLEAGRNALLAPGGGEDGGVVPVTHVRRLTTTVRPCRASCVVQGNIIHRHGRTWIEAWALLAPRCPVTALAPPPHATCTCPLHASLSSHMSLGPQLVDILRHVATGQQRDQQQVGHGSASILAHAVYGAQCACQPEAAVSAHLPSDRACC